MVGRVIGVERPGFEGIETTRNFYDAKGRLIRTEFPGRAATLYQYNALGNRTTTGLDVDADGHLSPASMDRITIEKSGFTQIDDAWWRERVRSVLAGDNRPEETIVAIARQRLTGWQGRVVSEKAAIDINGNETRAVATLDRSRRTRTESLHAPDSSISSQAVYVDGRLAEFTSKSGITTTCTYDGLGRRMAVEDPRKGTTRLDYDQGGRLSQMTDAAGNRTRFQYDSETGLKIAAYNALNQVTRYAYNPRGQLVRTWGDVPYPIEYRYDAYGRMAAMGTFRGGTGWKGVDWPINTGPADHTRWHYQPATGLLLAKEDARGNRTTHTYGAGGALATRTWARLKNDRPLRITYDHDPATGDLSRIAYSDDTPGIDFAYDRLGRKRRVNDAAGVRRFSYNDKLQLVKERLTGRQRHETWRSYDKFGRATGVGLNDDYEVSYDYDDRGRFGQVAWRIGEAAGEVDYSYLAQSDRLRGLAGDSGFAVHYEEEFHRDVRTAVTNTFGDRLISRYEYQHDPLGRRINAKQSGEAFEQDCFWLYGYNDRNEVTTASRFAGDDLKDQTRPLKGLERVYRFDPIGNRIAAVEGDITINYQTNALNQVETISGSSPREEGLSYDDDGNLIEDGRFRYAWNAENRLVAVAPKIAEPGSRHLEFVYDYMGRRISKMVFAFDGGRYVPFAEHHFVYDGWNMIRETRVEKETPVDRWYVWGLDLSQLLQGAGGVGGLLAASDGSSTYRYAFDGNGNVGQLVDAGDGSLAAQYAYDVFGKALRSIQTLVSENPFRFSTKYFDSEIGFYYFGYRSYSTKLESWINQDPQENFNLYGFNHNNPIGKVDFLGLYEYAVTLDDIKEYLVSKHDVPPESALNKYQSFPSETREWIVNEIRAVKGAPEITEVFAPTDFDDKLTPYITIPQNGVVAVFPQKGFWMCKEELVGDAIIGPLHHRFIVRDGIGHGYEKSSHFLWSNPGEMRIENELKPRKDVRCYELKCLLPECASNLLDLIIGEAADTNYFLGYRDCQSWANYFAHSAYEECEDQCCEEVRPNREYFKRTGW